MNEDYELWLFSNNAEVTFLEQRHPNDLNHRDLFFSPRNGKPKTLNFYSWPPPTSSKRLVKIS